MVRNSAVYRRCWYYKKRNTGGLRALLRILLVATLLCIFIFYVNRQLTPNAVRISMHKVEARISQTVYDAAGNGLENGINYENLMNVTRDSDGRITSVQANYVEMTRLSAYISSIIQKEISELENENIAVPAGLLFGMPILSGAGPDIYVKLRLAGNVRVDFKSEFEEVGENRTNHKILLQIRARLDVICPLVDTMKEIITVIPVAETIIIGAEPQAYG